MPSFSFSLHSKQFPLLGPVLGEAFAELGKGDGCGFFAVQDGFDDVRRQGWSDLIFGKREARSCFWGRFRLAGTLLNGPHPPGRYRLTVPGGIITPLKQNNSAV